MHNDIKLAEFDLFNNLWKETLILSQLKDPKIPPVLSFGQLPEGIIYREIEEVSGYTLEEYIKEMQTSARITINAHMRMESIETQIKPIPSLPLPEPFSGISKHKSYTGSEPNEKGAVIKSAYFCQI